MDWIGLAQKMDSYKHECQSRGFIKCGGFLACLRNYWIIKKNCVL